VGPMIPAGRQASDAWRALHPRARADAWAAAKQGRTPGDVGVAWAAAGYGKLVAGRLRIAMIFIPLAFIVLLAGTAATIAVLNAPTQLLLALLPVLLIGYLGGLITVRVFRSRYQRLYNSGLLGVEAAHVGGVPAQASPAVWGAQAYQSEFTVPYQASVPVLAPAARPPAAPAYAGTQEVTVRRGPLALQLGVLVLLAGYLWLRVILLAVTATSGLAQFLIVVWLILAVVYTGSIGFVMLTSVAFLFDPVVARFTPAGWELPHARMAGPWARVREIRVRSATGRRGLGAAGAAATLRVVALVVEDPEWQLQQAPPLRRYLARRAMKRYGSPVTIVASPRRTMPVVGLVQILQRYTNAPLNWG
jgi:hypothetical protein